jgi:hypothetical protein
MDDRQDKPADDYALEEDEREIHSIFSLLREEAVSPLRDLSQSILSAIESYLEDERSRAPSLLSQLRDMAVELVNQVTSLVASDEKKKEEDQDDD